MIQLWTGDCRDVLPELLPESVQTIVTSPPYFGLRNYGSDQQIGLESSVDDYVSELVAVFRAAWRVLRNDGTLWLVLGDTYARTGGTDRKVSASAQAGNTRRTQTIRGDRTSTAPAGLKDKDLIGIPWRVALALQADGWTLRSDIIWHKPNPMPESVRDRPTKSHEYIFLLTKGPRYYYDAAAIAEPAKKGAAGSVFHAGKTAIHQLGRASLAERMDGKTRNKRTVWTVATQPTKEAHFATFPPKLIIPCIKAGSREGDTVLDPFAGAGTTGLVAKQLGRSAVLIELNPDYTAIASRRIFGESSARNERSHDAKSSPAPEVRHSGDEGQMEQVSPCAD